MTTLSSRLFGLLAGLVLLMSAGLGSAQTRTWVGNSSTNWLDAANWSGNNLPGGGSTVVIQAPGTGGFQPTILTGTITNINLLNLTVNAGAVLTIQSGIILRVESGAGTGGALSGGGSIVGAGAVRLSPLASFSSTVSGTLSIDNLQFQNNFGIIIPPGSTVTINNALTFTGGNTTVNNSGSIIFKSSSSTTAYSLVSLGATGTFSGSGTYTVERYVGGSPRWIFLASPITDATIGEWSELSPIVSPPNNASIFYFDESDSARQFANGSTYALNGWKAAPNTTDLINTSGKPKGFRLYARSSFVSGPNPVVSVTGNQLYSGTVNVPLTKTANQYLGGGYNFIGNPYPSSVNFDNLGFGGGINRAYFIYDGVAGVYNVYVGGGGSADGVGVNIPGGAQANQIASGQSFFIKTANASTLSFSENAKVANGARTFIRTATPADLLRIKLSDNAKHAEETVIRFRANGTTGFDQNLDAASFSGDHVTLSSLPTIGNENLDVNTLPTLKGTKTVGLFLSSTSVGTHTLAFSDFAGFDPAVSITLIDHVTGTRTNVRTTPSYTFQVTSNPATTGGGRFEVTFTDARITDVKQNLSQTANLSVWPNPASAEKAISVGVTGSVTGPASVSVIDALGKEVFTQSLVLNGDVNAAFPISTSLVPGTYTVRCQTTGQALTTRLVVGQ